MGTIWQQPSPSDWDRYLAAISAGTPPFDAARAEGMTCSAFRRDAKRKGNEELAERYAQALVDRRDHREAYVEEKLVENVERSMQAVEVLDNKGHPTGVWRYEGSIANRSLELLGKQVGMFSDKLELTGAEGGPIEVDIAGKAARLREKLAALLDDAGEGDAATGDQ